MKNITIAFFVLFSLSILAQGSGNLKSADTLYFVLKEAKEGPAKREIFEKFTMESFSNIRMSEYMIKDSLDRVIFINTQKNTNNTDKKNISIKRKKFMRRNKNQIIYFDFIKQFYPDKFFFDYLATNVNRLPKKIIYIIDEDSLKRKDKDIVLKRAAVVPVSYATM